MKDNLDIEKLFKDKFENFEVNVNPKLWNNIANSVQTTSAVSTGISATVKALLIGTAAVSVGVGIYFIGGFNQTNPSENQPNSSAEINISPTTTQQTINKNTIQSTIIAQDNDPVIDSHKTEILDELTKHQTDLKADVEINNFIDHSTNTQTVNNSDNDNSIDGTVTEETTPQQTNHTNNNQETNKLNQTTTHSTDLTNVNTATVYPSGQISISTFDNKFKYQFKANAQNAIKIIWHFGDGVTSNKENPVHFYESPGEYEVTLTLISEDNELYEEQKVIIIQPESSIDNIPNVITPNGDRINDEFIIKTTNIDEFNIVIKDQMGNIVFKSDNKDFTWDGTDLSGNPVNKALYVYYIYAKGTDGAIYKIPGQLYVR